MCLFTTQQEPLIAEEDIEVYKILRDDLSSPSQEFKYEQNKLYSTEDEEKFIDYIDIDISDELSNKKVTYLKISKGFFHSYMLKKYSVNMMVYFSYFDNTNRRLFKAIIPKGAKYYIGDVDICSNKIIITSEIRIRESAHAFPTAYSIFD
jgi:hypothetical protein